MGELAYWVQEGYVFPDDIELVLEVISSGEGLICGYYFVNHERRCLFWLEKFDANALCKDIRVVVSYSHLGESPRGFGP